MVANWSNVVFGLTIAWLLLLAIENEMGKQRDWKSIAIIFISIVVCIACVIFTILNTLLNTLALLGIVIH
jgi:hypothetical protein